jgi:hypothetical protein
MHDARLAMSAIRGERVKLRQRSGEEVELVVSGDEHYATYETVEGFPVIFDDQAGSFCHARLNNGRLESTSIPAQASPPTGAVKHVQESAEVRQERARTRLNGPRGS